MPSIPESMFKTVSTWIVEVFEAGKEPAKELGKIGNGTWKIAHGLGFVEFYNKNNEVMHRVPFTEAEQQHLRNGGTIVITHACGTETHVSLPNPNPLKW